MPGDRILLCSDGLSNELSIDSLAKLASAPKSLADAANELVTAAKHSGGRDNISVVLLEFDEVNTATSPIKKTVSTKAPPVASSPSPGRARSTRRRRIVTWRVGLGVLILAGVIAGAVAIMHWYAYSSFYLADDAGTVAVYQGQPNGVLWYKPNLVLDLPYSSRQLRNADIRALRGTISEPTLSAAINFAKYMHSEWVTSRPLPPVTTTTIYKSVTTTTLAKG